MTPTSGPPIARGEILFRVVGILELWLILAQGALLLLVLGLVLSVLVGAILLDTD